MNRLMSAYIVIWMIRHGFVIDRDGKINELTGILKTNYMMGDDPVISLKSYTGCRLRIEDISPEIVPFAKNYFSRLPPFPIDASRRMYIFDYYITINCCTIIIWIIILAIIYININIFIVCYNI